MCVVCVWYLFKTDLGSTRTVSIVGLLLLSATDAKNTILFQTWKKILWVLDRRETSVTGFISDELEKKQQRSGAKYWLMG